MVHRVAPLLHITLLTSSILAEFIRYSTSLGPLGLYGRWQSWLIVPAWYLGCLPLQTLYNLRCIPLHSWRTHEPPSLQRPSGVWKIVAILDSESFSENPQPERSLHLKPSFFNPRIQGDRFMKPRLGVYGDEPRLVIFRGGQSPGAFACYRHFGLIIFFLISRNALRNSQNHHLFL